MNSLSHWKIIKQFSTRNMFGFAFRDVVKAFPERHPVHLARILSAMVDEGILCRITGGIYHIVPLSVDPKGYFPDRLQVAKYLMLSKRYYIGYSSAMLINGLAGRSEATVYIVTRQQKKPSQRSLRGISYQFIQHGSTRFFGFNLIWINQFEKAMVSDLEKTIVDIATKPWLGGGIVEVGNALYKAKTRIDHEKLFYYFVRNGQKAAIKRYLFLTELLGLEWNEEHERMMGELGSGITFLDPSAPNIGKSSLKYGLKINVDPKHIKKKIFWGPYV